MSFFDAPFEGNPSRRSNTVDLSTSTSTSSTALLSSIRLERLARDKQRRQEHAATLIQRMWRGRSEARRMRERLLDELEQGNGGVGKLNMVLGGNATMGLGRATHVDERARRVLVQWVQRVMRE
jgi:ubiquitin-protein ligase E3 C